MDNPHDSEIDPAPIKPLDIPPETNQIPDLDLEPLTIDMKAVDITKGENTSLPQAISHSQEVTRAKIAWTFTQIFLLLVIISLILPLLINLAAPGSFRDSLETSKQLLTAVASVLAGPFGFIVGFYFKQEQSEI